MKHSRVLYSAVVSLAVLGATACAVTEDMSQRKAQDIWKEHESIVAHAVHDGEPYDTDQFVRSVDFFREVAGIEVSVEIYTMGYMPIAQTSEDLELVRTWFAANGDRLYYDGDLGTVRVEGGGVP